MGSKFMLMVEAVAFAIVVLSIFSVFSFMQFVQEQNYADDHHVVADYRDGLLSWNK